MPRRAPGWPGRAARRALAAGLVALAAVLPSAAAAWFEAGRPQPVAAEAVALLAEADSHGLNPADYGAAALQQAVAQAGQQAAAGRPLDAAAAAALAQRLDEAVVRYLMHLHRGRVDPRRVHHGFVPPARGNFEPAALLAQALAAGRLAPAVEAAVPTLPQYAQLRAALARYRALAADPAWAVPLPALPLRPVPRGAPAAVGLEPGQPWAGLPLLRQRLERLGDLAPAATPAAVATPASAAAGDAAAVYGGDLVAAVQRFQRRHGLADDGLIGRATLAALQVGPAQRARQIVLSLERLRWTPLLQARRMIVINVPEFVLRAYEVDAGSIRVQQTMRVIVGQARDSRTPLFSEPMRSIEFSPYWNVPRSIARDELVPRLRRDPAHFAAAGFEFVTAGGAIDTRLSAARLDEVLAGRARLRQRPGPANALGDIKFVFPNRDAIYLHHTPTVNLFDRDRRDFSHGCIRVEDPVGLARFVLDGEPEWTEDRIRAAMAAGRSNTLQLREPLPVLIAYATALVTQGELRFFSDLYGYDALLERALRSPGSLPARP